MPSMPRVSWRLCAGLVSLTVLVPSLATTQTVTTPAGPHLNEVRILAVGPDVPFVEIDAGTTPLERSRLTVRNERGQTCALRDGPPLAPGTLTTIGFGPASPNVGFAGTCPGSFVAADGWLELHLDGMRRDRLEWGDTPFGERLRARGGLVPGLVPGTSFGRPPDPTGGIGWVRYGRAQVTPGAPNPRPVVDAFPALPGGIFPTGSVPLRWYGIEGAAAYRVQVAADGNANDFSAPLVDRAVPASGQTASDVAGLVTSPLAPGSYIWRVQAIGQDADSASFSDPQRFEVEPRADLAPAADTGEPSRRGGPLEVPMIYQHKDTRLLALEADAPGGAKPWDAPWADRSGPYCARASIAMVTAFYGGRSSQDRITYAGYEDRLAGPEVDIYVRAGFNDAMIAKALQYALGARSTGRYLIPRAAMEEYRRTGSSIADGSFTWDDIVAEMDAGRPVIGTTEFHAFVVVGYRRGANDAFEILINDPALGSYAFRPSREDDIATLRSAGTGPLGGTGDLHRFFFLPPRSAAAPATDEGSVSEDSDGDGVTDFDELVRFKTDPHNRDTDADGVGDKVEIRASVFEPEHGWSVKTSTLRAGERFPAVSATGRDFDGDGLMMETDPDSDGGGCKDGEEDLNGNGLRDAGETSNFDPDDDPVVDGRCGIWTGTFLARFDIVQSAGGRVDRTRGETRATVSLRQGPDGTVTGSASVTAMWQAEFTGRDPCPRYEVAPVTRKWDVSLTGEFTAGVLSLRGTPDGNPRYETAIVGCGSSQSAEDQSPQFDMWRPITFTDGRYDLREDIPLRAGESGEFYQEIHLRQAGR
jgi:hypothetical protein